MENYFFGRNNNMDFFENPEFKDCKIFDLVSEVVKLEKENKKGITNCPKCRSGNVSLKTEQRRRSDEPPTIYIKCNDCGYSKEY